MNVESDGGDGVTLKAGSSQHQHLVEIKEAHGGTEFALVALDLPRHIAADSGDASK